MTDRLFKIRAGCLAAAALWMCCSCSRPSYPPPAQIVWPSGPEPLAVASGDGSLLALSDPDANAYIVSDVPVTDDVAGMEWRTTGIHPRFRLQLRSVDRLDFYIRFQLPQESIRARGLVTLTITINGHGFRSYRFSEPGEVEYRRPIPAEWIPKPGPVDIAVDVEPPWLQADGTIAGVWLHSIGFERRPQ